MARVLVKAGSEPGKPAGSAVDEVGNLWNAGYGGVRILNYALDDQLDRVLALPVSQIACCTFGGPRLGTLFITTATQRLTPEARARELLAGDSSPPPSA